MKKTATFRTRLLLGTAILSVVANLLTALPLHAEAGTLTCDPDYNTQPINEAVGATIEDPDLPSPDQVKRCLQNVYDDRSGPGVTGGYTIGFMWIDPDDIDATDSGGECIQVQLVAGVLVHENASYEGSTVKITFIGDEVYRPDGTKETGLIDTQGDNLYDLGFVETGHSVGESKGACIYADKLGKGENTVIFRFQLCREESSQEGCPEGSWPFKVMYDETPEECVPGEEGGAEPAAEGGGEQGWIKKAGWRSVLSYLRLTSPVFAESHEGGAPDPKCPDPPEPPEPPEYLDYDLIPVLQGNPAAPETYPVVDPDEPKEHDISTANGDEIEVTSWVYNRGEGLSEKLEWAVTTEADNGGSYVTPARDPASGSHEDPGLPGNGGRDTQHMAVTYKISKDTPDGTKICFINTVTPGSGKSTEVAPEGEEGDGGEAGGEPAALRPFLPSWLVGTAHAESHEGPEPGGETGGDDEAGNEHPESGPADAWHNVKICYKIINPSYPYLTTSGGDVHAGGDFGINVDCDVSDDPEAEFNIRGQSQEAKSTADYIVSALQDIREFEAPVKFGNESGKPGYYGQVCRPDLFELAEAYKDKHPTRVSSDVNDIFNTPAGQEKLIIVDAGGGTAPINRGGQVQGKVTLYVKNGSVLFTEDIAYTGGGDPKQLPAFGVLASEHIKISPQVTQLHGYYVAGGNIDTCDGIDLKKDGLSMAEIRACGQQLTVYGLMMANSFEFKRTGTSRPGLVESEIINFIGDLYLSPPPAFRETFSPKMKKPHYQGERPPLY